jgi:hypothetical protein
MARTVETATYPRRRFREGPPIKLSWSAIFGGVVTALGIWALLYALGLALGLSAINPDNPESAKPSGIFAGLWSLLVPLVALFIGGAVASRSAGLIHRGGGAIHGLVMWGVTAVGGALLVGNLLGSALGGVAQLGSGALRGGMQMGQRMDFGLNADDAIAPINERLQAEGKPTVTAEQLENASRDVLRNAVREGKVDRESLVGSIANETSLSREDSEELATRVESQFDTAKQKFQTGALKAADATGKAFWGVFGALLFGMCSAILGGIFGVSRRQQREAELGGVGPTVIVEEHPTTGFPQQPLHQ